MLEGNADQLVLLIRGELLRRYPNPIVYAVRALGQSRDPQLGTQELYPMFRGAFDADIALLRLQPDRGASQRRWPDR